MKKQVLVLIFLLLGLFVGESFAVEVTVFGPKQYLRTAGSKDVYANTFSAIPGEGKLIVRNGNQSGERRVIDAVSSAVVTVNGEQIFGPNDFNKQVYYLEAPINLGEDNSISIELASEPDSYITSHPTLGIYWMQS